MKKEDDMMNLIDCSGSGTEYTDEDKKEPGATLTNGDLIHAREIIK